MNAISLVLVLLTFLFSSKSVESCSEQITNVNIFCSALGNYSFPSVGFVYECYHQGAPEIIVTVPDSQAVAVLHNNGSAVTQFLDIEALDIVFSRISFIPDGIKTLMPNLRVIRIRTSGLLSMNKENLRQFGNDLELASFVGNHLTSLDADLFEFNPNLRWISFSNNPIRHIDPRFFDHLPQMETLELVWLIHAGCMDQSFNVALGDLNSFEWQNDNCFNETARVESMLHGINGRLLNNLNDNSCLRSDVENLNGRMNTIEEKLDRIIESLA